MTRQNQPFFVGYLAQIKHSYLMMNHEGDLTKKGGTLCSWHEMHKFQITWAWTTPTASKQKHGVVAISTTYINPH